MEGDVEGKNDRLVRMQLRAVFPHKHGFADVAAEPKPAGPFAGSKSQSVKKLPVGKGHICHQDGRYMKLIVSRRIICRQIREHFAGEATAACHNHTSGPEAVELPI